MRSKFFIGQALSLSQIESIGMHFLNQISCEQNMLKSNSLLLEFEFVQSWCAGLSGILTPFLSQEFSYDWKSIKALTISVWAESEPPLSEMKLPDIFFASTAQKFPLVCLLLEVPMCLNKLL